MIGGISDEYGWDNRFGFTGEELILDVIGIDNRKVVMQKYKKDEEKHIFSELANHFFPREKTSITEWV